MACGGDVDDREDSDVGAGATDSTQPADGPVCGNGVIEAGESCDAENFGEASCESLALGTGQLSCSDACEIIATECEDFMATSDGGGGTGSPATSGGPTSGSDSGPVSATATDTGVDDGDAGTYGDEGFATSLGDDGLGPSDHVCVEYGAAAADCYGGLPGDYADFCYSFVSEGRSDPVCAAAIEEYFACLSDAPCGQFEQTCGRLQVPIVAACS